MLVNAVRESQNIPVSVSPTPHGSASPARPPTEPERTSSSKETKPRFSTPVKPARTLASQGFVTALAVSLDGKTLVVGNDDSRPVENPKLKREQPIPPTHKSNIQIWRLPTGVLVSTFSTQYPVWSVAISSNGRMIASQSMSLTANTNQLLSYAWQGETQIWDETSGRLLHSLPHVLGISTACSLDGKFVAAPLLRGIGIWDVATGKQVKTVSNVSRVIAFSPDNRTMVAARNPGESSLFVLNWQTGKAIRTLNTQREPSFLPLVVNALVVVLGPSLDLALRVQC